MTVSRRASRPARSSTALVSPATGNGRAARSRSCCSMRVSRGSAAAVPLSRLENTPANASTATVSTAPPAPAATSGQGKSGGSHAVAEGRRGGSDDADGRSCLRARLGRRAGSGFARDLGRLQVDGRGAPPPGPRRPARGLTGTAHVVPIPIQSPAVILSSHTNKSAASERPNRRAQSFSRPIKAASVGAPATCVVWAPAVASGPATCRDRQ